MINSNYISPDRSNKLIPSSPQSKRKHADLISTPVHPHPNIIDQRKDPVGPQQYYAQKMQNAKPLDVSVEKEYSLQGIVRQLSDRMVKMSQKLGQHQAILIKITENSIQSNKQQFKKSSKGDSKQVDLIADALNKLRRDFQDYKVGNISTRQIQVKNQLFSDLIHKSQERMRQQIQQIRSVIQLSAKDVHQDMKPVNVILSDQRFEELNRAIRKLEKNVSLNTTKIFGAYEKLQTMSSSLDGHMELINVQLNKNINKIVNFVNEKVSKPLNDSISKITEVTERVDKIESEFNSSYFGGMKSSMKKSQKPATKAQYKETLTAFAQEIIISQKIYYIDIQGYLLDQEYYYLVNKADERIKLDECQIKLLKASSLIS